MRRLLASLLLLLALVHPCAASQFDIPFVIGSNSAAAGNAVLTITTSQPCGPGAFVFVAVGQTASVTAITSVTDSASNTYNSTASTGTGAALQRLAMYTTRTSPFNTGLASGSTITITYGTNTGVQTAQAICWTGQRLYSSPADSTTTGVNATSTTPAVTPTVGTKVNDIMFVVTLLTAGGGDTWTESTGYTSITPVLATDAVRVSYQFVQGTLTPTAYSATNSASRAWVTIGATWFSQLCNVASSGGGRC